MFDAPSAEDRLLAVKSSDPAAAGAGGRILWIPDSSGDQQSLTVSGPLYFYHRLARQHFGVTVSWESNSEKLPLVNPVNAFRMDFLTATIESADFTAECRQSALPSDALVAEIALRNGGDEPVSVVVEAFVDAIESDRDGQLRSITAAYESVEVDTCLYVPDYPSVDVRSVAMILTRTGTRNGQKTDLEVRDCGDAIASAVDARPASTVLESSLVTADGQTVRRGIVRQRFTIPPGGEYLTRAVLAINETIGDARISARLAAGSPSVSEATNYWIGYLGTCPQFSCSNRKVESRFINDWVDARLLSSASVRGANPYREAFLGTRTCRFSDATSTMRQLRSERWNQAASLGRSSLLNYLHFQRSDGALPTRIDFGRVPSYEPSNPDWSAFWDYFLVHPNRSQLRRVYHAICDYARFVDVVADPDQTGLYDEEVHVLHPETIFRRGTDASPVKGVVQTVRQYKLRQALAAAATVLGLVYDAQDWRESASRIRIAFRNNMWDSGTTAFCNVEKATGQLKPITGVHAAAQAALPFSTDLVEVAHLAGLRAIVSEAVNRNVPPATISSAESLPNNVESYLGVPSHMVEALVLAGIRYNDADLLHSAARLFLRNIVAIETNRAIHRDCSTVATIPFSADVGPITSDCIDHVLRFVCGITLHLDGITIRPLPFLIDSFELDRLVIRNNHVGVWRQGDRFGVKLDGEDIATAQMGESIDLDIPV